VPEKALTRSLLLPAQSIHDKKKKIEEIEKLTALIHTTSGHTLERRIAIFIFCQFIKNKMQLFDKTKVCFLFHTPQKSEYQRNTGKLAILPISLSRHHFQTAEANRYIRSIAYSK